MRIRTLNSPLCLLGEGPTWNDGENAIYWLDILNNRIYRKIDSDNNVDCIWETDSNIGGMAFYENGDIAVFVKQGVKRLAIGRDGLVSSEQLIFAVELDPDERYNDIIVDPQGRIFAGTMKPTHKDGKLILFCNGKQPKTVLRSLGISNGMGFSPCEQFFYHTDTKYGAVTRYDYDKKTAHISSPVVIYTAVDEDGGPDGMTVDENGDLWIACWGAFQILHVTASGKILERIKIDAKQVSSLTFGGKDLNKVFVTTAGIGADDQTTFMNDDGTKMGGNIFEIEMNVKGKKDYIANI